MTLQNAPQRPFWLAVDLWLLSVCLGGCSPCTLYQRRDVAAAEFYLAEVCHEGTPQQTTTLICTSKTRLKTGARDCK